MNRQRGNAAVKALAILLVSMLVGTAGGYMLTGAAYDNSTAAMQRVEAQFE